MEKAATDIYTFENLRKGGYSYVDKTAILKKLADDSRGRQFFIARPRRFGNAEVSVANGATLDFASAEMSLARLKVDMDAGGGTITRFTPGVGGVIDLVSASSVSPGRVIPLTMAEVASPENLKSWTVKVNGNERADLGIRWSGGVLRVSGGGLRIIFR